MASVLQLYIQADRIDCFDKLVERKSAREAAK